jgi:glycosyltransferase involved in cell wall biosynthesis
LHPRFGTLRIVIAHNRYKFSGGEDTVMRSELEMLRRAGHEVELLEADNVVIDSTVAKIAAAGSLFHSHSSSRKMTQLLRRFRPHVLHIHNWFPLLSPSIISAAMDEGVPVVQTLHNFRMFCANGILYRDGKVCVDCAGRALPLGAIVHGCYSSSRVGSALVTAAFSYHRIAHTWDDVSTFIAVSEYQRDLLIRGGVPSAQVVVKPNFVKHPGKPGAGDGEYALYVGRLTPQKGIRTILNAWAGNKIAIKLKIMGDGPLAEEVRERTKALPCVQYLGQQSPESVRAAMAGAKFLIFASESYEPFALTIVEAFSQGTPVLAADVASVVELVKHGSTGFRFTPSDSDDLVAKASAFLADPAVYAEMRRECRRIYEERYTDTINYRLLMDIYRRARISTGAR